jgi:peptide/nickel transport system substrate-binding protein
VKRRTAVLCLLLALLSACRRETESRHTEPANDSTPRFGGTVIRRLDAAVTTLNPVLVGNRYDTYVHRYLFTPLVDLSADLQPVAGLADRWDISPDNREYTFRLNRAATFSDNTPVRASDVLFTIRKIIDPASDAIAMQSYFELVDLTRSRIIDDHTLVIAFREPIASQLHAFTNLMVIPEHVYGKGNFANDFNETAVGSGPYTISRHTRGRELVLRRRETYWRQKPYIESVHFKVISDNTTAWNAARAGQIDETIVGTDLWDRERTNPQIKSRLEFLQFYSLAYNFVIWNTRRPQFADKRVRQALAMGANLKSVSTGLYKGTARLMNGHFVPEQRGFNDQVRPIVYDPEAARKLLTSVGWLDTNGDGLIDRDGRPLSFEFMITAGSPSANAIAQLLQADFKAIGVDMRIAVIDFAAAQQRFMRGNFDATYLSWDLDADPDPFPLFHSTQIPPRGQNYGFYANPEADRLIDAGRREFDPARRSAIYEQLHALLADDQPYMWIVQPSVKWVVNRRVRGAKLGSGYGLFLWYPGEFDWWLSDARPSFVKSQLTETAKTGS